MGLFGSLTASVSGLTAQGEAISVISDNLANVNTVGYKRNRAVFGQLVTNASSTSLFNAGGVSTAIQRDQDTQGGLEKTQSPLDLALSGKGFFKLSDTQEVTTASTFSYTRAGALTQNEDGYLVTPSGLFLQGWETDPSGTILDIQDPKSIELQSVGSSASATTEFSMGANLDSDESIHSYDTSSSLATNLASVVSSPTSSDFIADARFFDEQGNARDVSVAFTKRASNLWDWNMYTDGVNIDGGTSGTNTSIGSGTLRFNQNGTLKNVTGGTISADWADGVSDGSISLDFGNYTGGNVVSSTTNLDFTDHILDIGVDDDTLSAGTYFVHMTADATFELRTAAAGGGSLLGSGTIGASGTRTLEFESGGSDIGVRITFSGNFDEAPGGYPLDAGDFTVAAVSPANISDDGTDGVLQFAAPNNTRFITQDGFASGSLNGVSVDEDGFVLGTFTNGESKKLWKVAIAIFPNPAGLQPSSNSTLTETDSSGRPLLKEAGVGGAASIVSGSLESSTVDIASEFSTMIVSQRAYQAGSSVISTVDQMLNDLMQLR